MAGLCNSCRRARSGRSPDPRGGSAGRQNSVRHAARRRPTRVDRGGSPEPERNSRAWVSPSGGEIAKAAERVPTHSQRRNARLAMCGLPMPCLISRSASGFDWHRPEDRIGCRTAWRGLGAVCGQCRCWTLAEWGTLTVADPVARRLSCKIYCERPTVHSESAGAHAMTNASRPAHRTFLAASSPRRPAAQCRPGACALRSSPQSRAPAREPRRARRSSIVRDHRAVARPSSICAENLNQHPERRRRARDASHDS